MSPNDANCILAPKPAELVTLPSYMASHVHAYAQVVIGLKGQAEFEVNGSSNYIRPGQGCVVTSGSEHAFGSVIGKSNILVLNMLTTRDCSTLMEQSLNKLLNQGDIYFQLDGSLQKLIHMLVCEMQLTPDDGVLSQACNDTVITLLHRHMSSFRTLPKASRFDVDVIDRYIEQNLSRKITVAQLAASVFLGESQFHSLFKEQIGATPHQYVLAKRIDMAKQLMIQGHLSLGQIAELTGFSGQSAFTHTFSRLQGLSPSAFKKTIS